VISNVLVTYTVKPEAIDEHLRLIDGVFAQLRSEAPTDLEYKVLHLADGVTFVHVSTAETPDGSNPLPALESFQAFAKDLPARASTPPNPTAATIVGSYYPADPIGAGAP
jgi:hypothetical protein